MAKSKVGGSRAYIRGRIGADVYSIGKDGKGSRQQVVRSLAEQVSNPRTESQMFGRMVMSTVMQAVSALKPIIDHSFDGLPTGQPSISEFIRQNYALVKADAIAHPANGNKFGLNKYQEKGVKFGAYVVSNGSVPKTSKVNASDGNITIMFSSENPTVQDLYNSLGITEGGYVTLVVVSATAGAGFVRMSVKDGVAATTAITSESLASIFKTDGNLSNSLVYETGQLTLSTQGIGNAFASDYIISRKNNGAFEHSKATLQLVGTPEFTSDVALPTYPTGTQLFLDGGDL